MYLKLFGLLLVFAIFQTAYGQCSDYRKCKTCLNSTYCAQCEENYYITTPENDGCCSRGCADLGGDQPSCDLTTGLCILDNCKSDGTVYAGPECLPCPVVIENCDICNENGTVICLTCVPGYAPTSNQQKCCPIGCADCVDDCSSEASTCECTACNLGWSPYLIGCDTCSDNCPRPSDNSTRCDPADGTCNAPCAEGRFGSWCNVTCTINNCNECVYDEPNKLLTCASCADGYYGTQCTPCSENCRIDPDPRVCQQGNGYCSNACNPGWRGNQCEIGCREAAELQNCQQCERFEFVCTRCDAGWFNTTCQQGCNINCGETEIGGGQTVSACDIQNGTCLTGCKPQHYKPDCSGYCPNCVNDICDRTTGICVGSACKPGYFGLECNNTCPTTCRNNNVTGLPECNYTDGSCIHGCDYNRYGSHCEFECSQYCNPVATGNITVESMPSCHQFNGTCKKACVNEYYLHNCTKQCGSLCVDNTCNITSGTCEFCNVPGNILCPTAACPSGKWGDDCDQNCSPTCVDVCERYSPRCAACKPGYHGDTCEHTCGNCTTGTCNQDTGLCESPCNAGWYGDYCNQTCVHGGCYNCTQNNGQCITCKPGLWGDNCNFTCSVNCTANDAGIRSCNKDSAKCDEGSCMPGSWGEPCTFQCHRNCIENIDGKSVCRYEDAYCSLGCKPKFYGSQCELNCSSTCVSGTCDRQGICSNGCIDFRYGPSCLSICSTNNTCNDNTCNRTTGVCTECFKEPAESRTALCRTAECGPYRAGLFCNASCPANCKDGICARYGGACGACNDGTWGTNCTNTCGQCSNVSCDQNDGTCTPCNDGFYGSTCTTACTYDGCQACGGDGRCTSCKPGLTGTNCDQQCSEFCDSEPRTCDRFNASCLANRCVDGYYLQDCSQACNEHCGVNQAGDRPCNIVTGVCNMTECDLTWYGPQCSFRCPSTCVSQNCDRSGNCRQGCIAGWFGDKCQAECLSTCNIGTCDRELGRCAACNLTVNAAPLCRTAECAVGSWGLYCNQTCPAQCRGGVCERDDGNCNACNDGYWGDKCTSLCPNCRNNRCFQDDGECVFGCNDGYYTLNCTVPCKHAGCQNCTRDLGECLTCKVGKYGEDDCSKDCSRYCGTGGNITCNKVSGDCDSGACIPRYWGRNCSQSCSEYCGLDTCGIDDGTCTPCVIGWYGNTCARECSDRCKNKDCVTLLNNCRQGCADGFWGGSCESNCSETCNLKACNKNTARCLYGCLNNRYYGDNCEESCNSNCAGGVCNTTGTCENGCNVGYYGDQCELSCLAPCVDGTCNRVDGQCDDCRSATPGTNCPEADCPTGKRGDNCELDCTSDNCLFDQCTRYNDTCITCPLTFYGELCDKSCPYCRENTACGYNDGICVAGCKDGWYGPGCLIECSSLCTSCDRSTGACTSCTNGRHGSDCTLTCSTNCLDTVINGVATLRCDKDDGACSEDACKAGYWSPACNQTCPANCQLDDDGLKYCELIDGACKDGCLPTYYGKICNGVCSDRCRNKLCQDTEDTCIQGCADRYYGPTCTGICSSQCADPGTCDSQTGKCDAGCKVGYYGDRCLDTCVNECLNGSCDITGICPDCRLDPVGSQCQRQVCVAGKYGPLCENDCPGAYCQDNQCNRQTGSCSNGCRQNYHGLYCTEQCDCVESGTLECVQTTGKCDCIATRYGPTCALTCNDGCLGSECSDDGQCSQGCRSGRYGSMCASKCTNCQNQDCLETTGVCNAGCNNGWYGDMCNQPCPVNCETCDQTTGTCVICKDIYYNPQSNCGMTCSSRCAQTTGSRLCNMASGTCLNGCVSGYYSEGCTETCGNCADGTCSSTDGMCSAQGCMAGWYGARCKDVCSQNCARGGGDNQLRCNQNTGQCTYGCIDGYHGNQCTSTCNTNCLNGRCTSATQCTDGCIAFYYGTGCTNNCPNCAQGACSTSGECQSGCVSGYYDTGCTRVCWETCLNDRCDVSSGGCSDCLTTPKGPLCRDQDAVTAAPTDDGRVDLSVGEILGISAGCVGIVILFVIVFVCCVNYMRRAEDAKNEIHLPSDMLERLSTHRSLHSTISTNYPVARVVGDQDQEKDFVLF